MAPWQYHNPVAVHFGAGVLNSCGIHYEGTEGELYNVDDDPHQFQNLWADAAHRALRSDLVADLYDALPAGRDTPLKVEAPA